jgi:type 1 glutamine amidotransferase
MKPHCTVGRSVLLPILAGVLFSLFTASSAEPVADRLAPFYQPGKLRALILSGRCNHDWRTTTPFLRRLLVETGRFDVRVAEAVDGLTSVTLAPYDVLVMDYGGPRWPEVTEKAVEDFVRGGKGMVLVHGAVYHFCGLDVITDGHRAVGYKEPPWPAFREMAGCGWDAMPSKGYHGARHTFPVKFTMRDHPIAAGLPESLPATDELYMGMQVLPQAQVLATAFGASSRGGMDREEPMLLVTKFGEGRVFNTVLGHELAGMWEEAFRITYVRGAEWAASGKVTLSATAGMEAPPSKPIRTLVVTGGHEFETSFYGLFEGHPRIRWDHATSNREAFQRDLRQRYDVVVLYDMSQELSSAGRTNLQAFVEGGKGLVVLHHALADYQDWEWWWREVVGGRYLLKDEAGAKGSTYRHDEWMIIEPAAGHPVIGDVGPLRLFDETYHGVWTAPGIKPLLKTTNPTSDPVVGWISPWAKSRVVCLQPGHGSPSHRHPAYRKLVQNAVQWTAGE